MIAPAEKAPTTSSAPRTPRERALEIAAAQPPARLRTHDRRHHKDSPRDTVESVVLAFVLAFLFRSFLAEAFVIPTGSMAQTLFGRHKDVVCPECATRYQVGASDEVDRDSNLYLPSQRMDYAFCPNCRAPMDVRNEPVFKGDRILVSKFTYDFSDPEPYEVVVFKYPVDPKINYIKRMIGLPGETIEIRQGDVWVRQGKTDEFQIRRKPIRKQRDLQMLVYDDDRPAKSLPSADWERWTPATPAELNGWQPPTDGAPAWQADYTQRTFTLAPTEEPQWLRYQHRVPSQADWQNVLSGKPPALPPDPLLIADFYAYNAGNWRSDPIKQEQLEGGQLQDVLGKHWVGDLTVSCEVDVKAAQGELLFELAESERRYRCAIDLATGQARLYYLDAIWNRDHLDVAEEIEIGTGATPIKAAGKYQVTFANVDDRLSLWVDDGAWSWGKDTHVAFTNGEDEALPPPPSAHYPTKFDLHPVGVAGTGADLVVSHLKIYRDVYYTSGDDDDRDQNQRRARLSNPEEYQRHDHSRTLTMPLSPDEFLVLGDNSPRSADSRLWDHGGVNHPHAVPRSHLLGKAFFIFWPHGVPFLNGGKGYAPSGPFHPLFYHYVPSPDGRGTLPSDYAAWTVPFYPQWQRWKFIR